MTPARSAFISMSIQNHSWQHAARRPASAAGEPRSGEARRVPARVGQHPMIENPRWPCAAFGFVSVPNESALNSRLSEAGLPISFVEVHKA